ncbi:hypothetical protein OIU84_009124, partial [Salix udensis]
MEGDCFCRGGERDAAMLLGAVLQWEGGGEREGDCFWLLQRRRARGLDVEERRGGERQTIRRS